MNAKFACAVILFFAMAVSLYRAISTYRRALASRHWTRTPCYDLNATLEEYSSNWSEETHRVQIHYRYRVGAREFQGHRYSFGRDPSGHRAQIEAVKQHRPAVCYYDPNSPEQSVLLAGPGGTNLFSLTGLALATFGAAYYVTTLL